MKGLFKSKPKSPVEVVRQSRNFLASLHSNAPDFRGTKRKEKMAELGKLIRELKLTLYGSNEAEPVAEACKKLTEEFFKENTACKDATQLVANLQRQHVESHLIAPVYLAENLDLLDILILGYEDLGIALHYGGMLRECIRRQIIARHVLESRNLSKFFDYIQLPNFDITADATKTFKFFHDYNSKLLESNNYVTRRQAVKLLGDILLHRFNPDVMGHYVSPKDNMRILMNLLKEPSKSIQIEAFHVFKKMSNSRKIKL